MAEGLQVLAALFMQTSSHHTINQPEASVLNDPVEKEAERLCALERYEILDSMPEAAYQDIVTLASHICEAPVALITFVDHERQWFKAAHGLDLSQTPREFAFCTHAFLNQSELLVIPDTTQDARFDTNPFVTGEPHLRFYAGAPLRTPDDQVLGTVCVLDFKPRQLSAAQLGALSALSRQVMMQLELRLNARRLKEAHQQFRAFADNAPLLAYIKDEAGRYEYVNAPLLRRFGFGAEDIIGKSDSDLWDTELIERIRALEEQVLQSGQSAERLDVSTAADGSQVFWRIYKFPLFWQGHRAVGSIAVDITQSQLYERELETIRGQLEARNATLRALSTTDELTNAHNRRSFIEHLRIEWERADRQKTPLSLLMIDVDRFKDYNDSFGHPAGDVVLKQLAQLLCLHARTVDIVARYGGEEFAVILPDSERQGARKLAERFRAAIETANWPRRNLTVSVGVATRVPNIKSPSVLIDRADSALYRAKQNGRNRVESAD